MLDVSLAVLLEDFGQDFSHVVDRIEDLICGVNRFSGREGKNDRVAGAGIDLDDFVAQLIFHREDEAGVEGAALDIGDDDALHLGPKSVEHGKHEVMGKRAFGLFLAEGALNRLANSGVDVDDESFDVVT